MGFGATKACLVPAEGSHWPSCRGSPSYSVVHDFFDRHALDALLRTRLESRMSLVIADQHVVTFHSPEE